ncbi:MAG: hypothetical protein ABI681_10895 [Gemmatimonadales bacterium]
MRTRVVTLLIAGLLGACATPSQPGSAGGVNSVIQVEKGREFEIGVGQEAHVQGTPITIRFRGVTEDSRCPSDVVCVWAGNAAVKLSLTAGEGSASEIKVSTTLEPKSVVFSGYRIALSGLKPAPLSGKPIPPEAYVATLLVTPP